MTGPRARLASSIAAVSYTHLDVYKRQRTTLAKSRNVLHVSARRLFRPAGQRLRVAAGGVAVDRHLHVSRELKPRFWLKRLKVIRKGMANGR